MYRKKKKRGVWVFLPQSNCRVIFLFRFFFLLVKVLWLVLFFVREEFVFQSSLNFGRPTRIPSFFFPEWFSSSAMTFWTETFLFSGVWNSRDLTALGLFSHSHLFYIKKKKKKKWNVILRVCLYKNIWCAAPLGRKKEKGPYVLFRGRGGADLGWP